MKPHLSQVLSYAPCTLHSRAKHVIHINYGICTLGAWYFLRGQLRYLMFFSPNYSWCVQFYTTWKTSLALAQQHAIGSCTPQICQCFPAITNMYLALQNSRFGPSVMCCWLPSSEVIQNRAAVSELIIMHSI